MKSLEQIDELKKLMVDSLDYESDLKELESIENSIRENLNIVNLKNNPGIVALLKLLKMNIELISEQLKENESLPEKERDRLFERRRCYRDIWGLFDNAEKILKTKEEEVENILKDNKEFIHEEE